MNNNKKIKEDHNIDVQSTRTAQIKDAAANLFCDSIDDIVEKVEKRMKIHIDVPGQVRLTDITVDDNLQHPIVVFTTDADDPLQFDISNQYIPQYLTVSLYVQHLEYSNLVSRKIRVGKDYVDVEGNRREDLQRIVDLYKDIFKTIFHGKQLQNANGGFMTQPLQFLDDATEIMDKDDKGNIIENPIYILSSSFLYDTYMLAPNTINNT